MDRMWVCLLLVLGACDFSSPMVENEFPGDCWNLTDTLYTDLSNWDPATFSQASLYVDFTDEYAYRNLILQMEWENPSGQSGDTLVRAFVVDSLGYWIPPESRDNSYRHTFAPLSTLLEEAPASLRVVQYMRDSSLCGIKRVGVLLGPLRD